MAIRDRIVNNRLSVNGFISLFIVLEIALLILYTKYGASFSLTGDRVWKLIVLVHVFVGGSLLLLLRSERNLVSLFTSAALPILIYEAFSWWRYSSSMRTIILAGLTCIVVVPLLAAAKVINVEADRSVKRRLFAAKTMRFTGVLMCIFLLAACVNGQILLRSEAEVYSVDVDYDGSYQEDGNENTLAANMPTIAKLDPDGGWADLSADEKTEVLAACLRVDSYYLGMHDLPSLKLVYLEEGLLGQYDYETDTIALSYTYLVDSRTDGYSVLHVILHELHHRYAIRQAEMVKKLRESSMAEYADLKLFDDATAYEQELESYAFPVDGSFDSYLIYYLQRIELDANKFADEGVADYYRKIDTYLRGD